MILADLFNCFILLIKNFNLIKKICLKKLAFSWVIKSAELLSFSTYPQLQILTWLRLFNARTVWPRPQCVKHANLLLHYLNTYTHTATNIGTHSPTYIQAMAM